jgi:thiol-disulfide isomerase/thioredoxin
MATVTIFTSNQVDEPTVETSDAVRDATAGVYTNMQGEVFSFAPEEHDITVVVSWATWCPDCEREVRQAMTIADEYVDHDVAVVLMNRAEPAARIQQYFQVMNLPVNESIVIVLLDPDDHLFASLDGYTAPETVLLARDGSVLAQFHGPMDLERVRRQIDEFLANQQHGDT